MFGGVVGLIEYTSLIRDCYNAGDLSGYSNIGGVLGSTFYHNPAVVIQNCYSVGKINGNNRYGRIGGIAGYFHVSSETNIENCYYLENCCCLTWINDDEEIEEIEEMRDSKSIAYNDSNGNQITTGGKTKAQMQEDDFIETLNTDGQVWKKDTNNINNGYPIL